MAHPSHEVNHATDSLYSHGSPMLALEPGASGVQPRRLATELPRPKAILVVSAHWESDDLE